MSQKESLISAIKIAMRGEMDSITLYTNAAKSYENSKLSDPAIREFFEQMREEERSHYNYLLQYYQEISNDLNPTDMTTELNAQKGFSPIISDNFLKRIGENQILFSAVSTALLLEKDAIDHYRKSANETDSITLKSFFEILVKWETSHYENLLRIQKEAESYYWQINSFEPF